MKRIILKRVPENSVLVGVGDLVRDRDGSSSWQAKAYFQTGPARRRNTLLDVEALCLLGLGKSFNVRNAKSYGPVAVSTTVRLPPVDSWREGILEDFPDPGTRQGRTAELKRQRCFRFETRGRELWLPKVELARKLFFHAGFLARAAFVPYGLDMLFDRRPGLGTCDTIISTPERTGVPAAYFRRKEYREFFSWLLLHPQALDSFQSIWKCLNREQVQSKRQRRWTFNFVPPVDLGELTMSIRGLAFPKFNAMLVWEVVSIQSLPNHFQGQALFYHPAIKESHGPGTETRSGRSDKTSGPVRIKEAEIEIDTEDEPAVRSDRRLLAFPSESLKFVDSFSTRLCYSGVTKAGNSRESRRSENEASGKTTLGIGDDVEGGSNLPTDFNLLQDVPDLTDYYSRFTHLLEIIERLSGLEELRLLDLAVAPLPKVKRCKYYMLDARTPRCYLLAKFSVRAKSVRHLLEIDTSDNTRALSTKIFQLRSSKMETRAVDRILGLAVKQSIRWPTEDIDKFCVSCTEVVHPNTAGGDMTDVAQLNWQNRIHRALTAGR